MQKLYIVANRLPVRFERTPEGLRSIASEGGLATGMGSWKSPQQKEWIGWPGIYAQDEAEEKTIGEILPNDSHPVFLTEKEVDQYYNGFSNETLWPLLHYFVEHTRYNNEYWEYYKRVNEKFCDAIVATVKKGDIIWVQDYHLMLLPGMLRERLGNDNPIGFFLHIPFSSYELFRTLPWRKELLEGVLGADLAGFHTYEYAQHFMDTVYRVLGYEVRNGAIISYGHSTRVDVFPMGISVDKFSAASESPEVIEQLQLFRQKFGKAKLVLSVDRLDYTKGIVNRLKSFDLLLTRYPNLREKVSLIMLMVPSRDTVKEYCRLKEEVDELVGNINGKHSTLTWTAIHYFYRSVPFEQLVALYNLADIGLVTPLRDGMNLVAKEYVASKNHGNGVLVLSEMAGAAIELEEAIRVNPNDQEAMVEALHTALHMNRKEQQQRMEKMQQQVARNTVEKWGENFITQLTAICKQTQKLEYMIINEKEISELSESFKQADNRLVILDYDGTLRSFCDHLLDARPDEELLYLLERLSKQATVVLISGRDHFTLEEWFGRYNIHLVAEHGIWQKENNMWKQSGELDNSWKSDVHAVLAGFAERTPGAFIEEKPFSLAFHYRRSDLWLSEVRPPQLINALRPLCAERNLNVLDGNKVVEVRIAGIDKGTASRKWLAQKPWDFIVAIGDDTTDEDIFAVMPSYAYTIKVGNQASQARWRARNCEQVRELLNNLTATGAKTYPLEENLHISYKKAV